MFFRTKLLPAGVTLACVSACFVFAQEEPIRPPEENGAAAAPAPARNGAAVRRDDIRVQPKRLNDYKLPGLDQKVYLKSLIPWDVVQLIEVLAREGKLNNVVIGKNVSGLTTKIKFDGVTVGDALETVLALNKLAYKVKGEIITIMTDDEYKALYGTSFYDHKQVKIVDLKHAEADRVKNILEKVKSEGGVIVADPVSRTLILIDMPDKITEMMAVVETEETPTQTRTFALQYAAVEDMQKEITPLLTKELGILKSDKRTKTLIITDLPQALDKIAAVISTFDQRTKQVFIEAKIVEVALSDAFSLGVNWQHMFDGLNPRFRIETVSQPGLPVTPFGTLKYNTIVSGGDLEAVLEALKTVGDTKILSSPHIAVVDGQEANIKVIEDQPYKEVKLESGTTNITGVTYLFKEVGVSLGVTPKINDDGIIQVLVKPEISSISQWYDGAPQEGTPVIKRAFAETTVMIKDGVTIIIGGLIKDRKDTAVNSIPILGAIPLLGKLFRYESTSAVNTETVVFMTPRIVTGNESYLRMKDVKKAPKPLRSVGSGAQKPLKPVR